MTTFSDTFTQGGQTQLHKLRMMKQVVGATVKKKKAFSFSSLLNHSSSSWLFMACKPEQREFLKPLFSGWVSLVIKALMRREEGNYKRTWVIIDELASLHKLPSLVSGLAEVRKYGGCFVLGFQDLSQLESVYGFEATKSLSNLTGTKVLFRSVDSQVADRVAKYLGDQEKQETKESISFGAHQMRDGVNLSSTKHVNPLVRATDIMKLENLEAYLKLPGDLPVTKFKFSYLAIDCKTPAFVAKRQVSTLQEEQTACAPDIPI